MNKTWEVTFSAGKIDRRGENIGAHNLPLPPRFAPNPAEPDQFVIFFKILIKKIFSKKKNPYKSIVACQSVSSYLFCINFAISTWILIGPGGWPMANHYFRSRGWDLLLFFPIFFFIFKVIIKKVSYHFRLSDAAPKSIT